ncbi:hypothetical protein ONQ97_26045, partial [Salmonella enterica subsp. enterica serovar Virginia]|nr:hypothetical protein [Salmonella enterica subsp. enterica serovar Virginia]
PEAKTLLMKVGAEYTAQIIKDGLKEKSAFGPWLPETKKAEAKHKDLKTGKNYSMSENPGNYYLQLCLTTSRSGLNIALSSDAWNA